MRQAQKDGMYACGCEVGTQCAYCNMPLAPKHEHDHMPYPERHGGEKTVPTCLNCHSLKDRMNTVEALGTEILVALLDEQTPPVLRILFASLFAVLLDAIEQRDQARAQAEVAA